MRHEEQRADLGQATLSPQEPIVADSHAVFEITFTCGQTDLQPAGTIRFDIPYGFSPPQISYRSQEGYCEAISSNDAVSLSVSLCDPTGKTGNEHVWAMSVFVTIEARVLAAGDTVTLYYGRPARGGLTSRGARVRYFEGQAEFPVLVDPDGSRSAPHGGFLLIAGPVPTVRIVGGRADHVVIAMPAMIRTGEIIPLRMVLRDRLENTATQFPDRMTITAAGIDQECPVDSDGTAACSLGPSQEMHTPFRVTIRHAELADSVSPACLPVAEGEPKGLFWGDLHNMTAISAGLERPDFALRYARYYSLLDFCAITDGDHADSYFSDEEWHETVAAVKAHHDPGQFVTLLASEYHERQVSGDKNIYYRTDEAPLLRWSDLPGDQPEALWQALEGTRALTVPHHPVSGSAGLDVWRSHHPEYQRLVEIYSIWGNSECAGCAYANYWHNNYDNSVRAALAKGYRLGIIASGDSHDGLAGNSSWMRLRQGYRNGLAGVFAPGLTREAIFDSLYDRHCYGTTGARIILFFQLNDAHMGQELDAPADRQQRRLRVRAIGTAPIHQITIVRNGSEMLHEPGTDDQLRLEWTDSEPFADVCLTGYDGQPFIYYYVRVEQSDGHLAWSSPIWVAG